MIFMFFFEALISKSSIISSVSLTISNDVIFSFSVEDSNWVIRSKSLIIYVSRSTLFSALFKYFFNNSLSSIAPSNRLDIYPSMEKSGVLSSCATFPTNSFLYRSSFFKDSISDLFNFTNSSKSFAKEFMSESITDV